MTSASTAPAPSATTDALVERLFNSTLAALEMETVYLGDRLGFYRALSDHGPMTESELAAVAQTDLRYTREWLEQQASAGFLEVDDPSAESGRRQYSLPAAYAEVLVDELSPNYFAWGADWVLACARPMDRIVEAYRSGGGVPWDAYGEDGVRAQARSSRPGFHHSIASEWLTAIPGLVERLQQPGARIADVATGGGWAAIEMARAFPQVRVDGLDLDEHSILTADGNLRGTGVEDRVSFQLRDAGDPNLAGQYDLVTIIEALHDMSHPVEALRAAGGMLAPGGVLLVVDENVDDEFRAPGTEWERFLYTYSVLTCLPAAMDSPDSAATGTVFRPSKLREYASAAGFTEVIELPIENDYFRFYQLR